MRALHRTKARLVPTAASGAPAFAQYRPALEGGYRAWAIHLLDIAGDRIASVTSFLDTEKLFPRFGLPLDLPSCVAAALSRRHRRRRSGRAAAALPARPPGRAPGQGRRGDFFQATDDSWRGRGSTG
ncbi:hypothetical protein WME73_41670 [Sorangium sp. So ce302]|uniref:hypothetical protein n=1 Tax=Sorangium sp. So ce302 TaxID=3133297 RepID=UPI003F6095EF